MIGYGSMLMEGVVGVVALIAATSLFPGDYFAINTAQRTDAQKAAYVQMVDEHSSCRISISSRRRSTDSNRNPARRPARPHWWRSRRSPWASPRSLTASRACAA